MTEITSLKETQKILTNLLAEFDKLCQKYDLKYSIVFGTLLGAIRHQGFIPWDNDIDVAMPREDYEKLLSLKYNDGRYEVKSYRYSKKYHYIFSKFSDNNTFIEEPENDGQDLGLWIDIFPFDYIDTNYYEKNLETIDKKMKTYPKLYSKFGPNINKKNSELEFKKVLAKYAHKIVLPFANNILSIFEKHIISLKGDMCVLYFHNFSGIKTSFLKSEWNNLTRVKFENIEVTAFKNYDKILKNQFGDYMTLPPKDERVSHQLKAYYR